MRGPGPVLSTLLVAILCVIWGSTWLVIREGLVDLPPFTSAAIRFALAAVLMVLVCHFLAMREGGRRAPLWLVLLAGTLNFSASYGAVYSAEQVLPSALSSVLFAVFPLLVAVMSHYLLPAERLRPKHALGFLLGFVGVGLLFITDVSAVGPGALPMAMVFMISPVVAALGTTVVKRYGGDVSSLLLNRDAMFVGAVTLGALAVLFERDASMTFTGAAIGSIAYLSVIGTVVTFSLYFWLLRYAPAYKLAVIPYVTPVVAIVLGVTIAGESVGASTFAGMGLILLGVLLVTRGSASRRVRR